MQTRYGLSFRNRDVSENEGYSQLTGGTQGVFRSVLEIKPGVTTADISATHRLAVRATGGIITLVKKASGKIVIIPRGNHALVMPETVFRIRNDTNAAAIALLVDPNELNLNNDKLSKEGDGAKVPDEKKFVPKAKELRKKWKASDRPKKLPRGISFVDDPERPAAYFGVRVLGVKGPGEKSTPVLAEKHFPVDSPDDRLTVRCEAELWQTETMKELGVGADGRPIDTDEDESTSMSITATPEYEGDLEDDIVKYANPAGAGYLLVYAQVGESRRFRLGKITFLSREAAHGRALREAQLLKRTLVTYFSLIGRNNVEDEKRNCLEIIEGKSAPEDYAYFLHRVAEFTQEPLPEGAPSEPEDREDDFPVAGPAWSGGRDHGVSYPLVEDEEHGGDDRGAASVSWREESVRSSEGMLSWSREDGHGGYMEVADNPAGERMIRFRELRYMSIADFPFQTLPEEVAEQPSEGICEFESEEGSGYFKVCLEVGDTPVELTSFIFDDHTMRDRMLDAACNVQRSVSRFARRCENPDATNLRAAHFSVRNMLSPRDYEALIGAFESEQIELPGTLVWDGDKYFEDEGRGEER